MTLTEIFKMLCDDIHTVVIATVDKQGLPEARVIDIMLYDSNGLYFITAKGKKFYESLTDKKYIALSGFKGSNTMSSTAISVAGNVEDLGSGLMDKVFKENPYMAKIYPSAESRRALTVFKLYRGTVEYFDLSKKPIERYSLVFGGECAEKHGYFINDRCISCGACKDICPQNCIDIDCKALIRQENCLHCGNCLSVCPVSAVERW